MTDINAVTAGAATTTTTSSTSSTSSITSDFDTFLQLLTAQLENQDPLNPLESTEFATQIATFSGVEQQVLTNDLLADLTVALGATEIGQLAEWVGLEVRAAMPVQFDGAPVTLSPQPATGADAMAILVRNENGAVVQRIELPVSSEPVQWAGTTTDGAPLPEGLYSFALESSAEGAVISTDAVEVYAKVREARSEGGETYLVFDGDARTVVEDVTAIRDPA
ncbi:MAG: flagellar hook capping FlgD N-terminal domain-containing protein [Pseudomonadota bacterium]